MFLVTNRYLVHVTIGIIAMAVGLLNLQTDEVRAETFGEKSLMYSLVTKQSNVIIEEYASDTLASDYSTISYRSPGALSSFAYGSDYAIEETYGSIIGGGTISVPTIAGTSESVAERDDVEMYTIQTGDTLTGIADRFGIDINTLLWSNSLSVTSILKPGDQLVILPVSGVYHQIKSGDTLSSIAQKYDVSVEEITEYNSISSTGTLSIGDKLIIPGGTVTTPTSTYSSTIGSIFSTPTGGTTTSTASPTTTGTGSMIWPTDLYVITQYYGWTHTGLDIDCGYTNDNYAADYGIVQYSGWKGGYGYTVEINHGNGIVTRYGHHSALYVSAGEQVSKGEAIGRCGTTGISTGTHLHFEVIVNGKFRNPLEYIR